MATHCVRPSPVHRGEERPYTGLAADRRSVMAEISFSLEGSHIQLSFQKDDQPTAVVMDARAARALVRAVGQLLTAIDEPDDGDLPEDMSDEEIAMLDVTSSAIE